LEVGWPPHRRLDALVEPASFYVDSDVEVLLETAWRELTAGNVPSRSRTGHATATASS
jgi:hypothetical protein